jgi:type II secretory pathway pseudopilin PulG
MPFYRNLAQRGLFSALEILVVLIVLGVVAAIVGPRMSRAAAVPPDTREPLLVGQLRALRSAIDAYTIDHHSQFPKGDVRQITAQLTQYTDRSGTVSAAPTPQCRFGPYLREIPAIPVGARKGQATLQLPRQNHQAAWVYDPTTGQIWANTAPEDCDATGRCYSTY